MLSFCRFLQYKSYKIRDGKNNTLPFIFNDLMGLQDAGTPGILSDDIINAMMGHVKENHMVQLMCYLLQRFVRLFLNVKE